MNLPAGIIPILPTPFTDDDGIDVDSLRGLVDFAIGAGASAVGTPAFGSEFYKLDGSERTEVIETVIAHSAGRMPVIVQCNHTSPRVAGGLARDAAQRGAAAVNTVLPRAFATSLNQLEDFASEVCDAVDLPVIVQDWNPGGCAVDAGFASRVHKRCPNFLGLKLEDPGIGSLIREVKMETGGQVGVFTGWGGMHLLELLPSGVKGAMPGLSLADVMTRIWSLGSEGQWAAAIELFARISAYLQFSLQTFEQFHHAEKRLLLARKLLPAATVRRVTVELGADASAYLDRLIASLLPLAPAAGPARHASARD